MMSSHFRKQRGARGQTFLATLAACCLTQFGNGYHNGLDATDSSSRHSVTGARSGSELPNPNGLIHRVLDLNRWFIVRIVQGH